MSTITPTILDSVRINAKTPSGYDILHPRTLAQYISYDNSKSGLNATNVYDAIDEIYKLPLDWFDATIPYADDSYWYGIAYGGNRFVAVADRNTPDSDLQRPPSDRATYSTNGVTWNVSTLPASAYWEDVCYGNNKFVAVAQSLNKVAYSTNGTSWSWSSGTLPRTQSWCSVCYGGGKFVAVARQSKQAAYSTTGSTTWTATTLPSDVDWRQICYGGGRFIAIAEDSTTAATSTNGTSWSKITLPFTTEGRSAICYGNGKFVIADGYKVAYSSNGSSWTTIDAPVLVDTPICYGNGKFVTKKACSTDLTNWRSIDTGLRITYDICYGLGKFVILPDGYSNIMRYANG